MDMTACTQRFTTKILKSYLDMLQEFNHADTVTTTYAPSTCT